MRLIASISCFINQGWCEKCKAKPVESFLSSCPKPCTAHQLIRAIYHATPEENKAILLGYVQQDGSMHLFEGDLTRIPCTLTEQDKLVIFSNH